MRANEALTSPMAWFLSWASRSNLETLSPSGEKRGVMEASRKPLAKVEGRRRMPFSGLTIAWRGTPSLDDWVAYIVRTKSKKFILADHTSERKVKTLLSRLKTMSNKEVEQLAKARAQSSMGGPPMALGHARDQSWPSSEAGGLT
jgi:hypothetical protein